MALNTEIDLERKQPLQGKEGWRLQFTVDTYRAIIEDLKAATDEGVTSIITSGGIDGGGTGDVPVFLSNTGVVPGSYTTADITVDEKGRITSVSNGSAAASVGTSNEHQVTDNAGGFVTSILQETGGQIGVGGVTTSAVFALDSVTDKGFTLPTMTLTQQAAIGTPVDGLQVHIEDGTISAPYYNHSTEGEVPVGRFSVKDQFGDNAGAPGTATLGTQNYFASVRAGTGLNGLSYGPLRWTYSAGGKNILPINPDTGQYSTGTSNTFSLGNSTSCFLDMNLRGSTYYRGKSSGTATEIASGVAGGYTLYTSGNDGGSVGGLSISPIVSTGVIAKFISRGNTSTDARGLLLDDIVRPTSATNIKAQTMDVSAFFQIDSTSRGFLQPRLTFAQQTAIAAPANGLQVHIEDGTDSIPYYNHSVDGWVPVGRYALKNAVYVNGSGNSTLAGNIAAEGIGGSGQLKLTGMRWTSSGLYPDINESTGAKYTNYPPFDLGYTQKPGRWRDVYAQQFDAKSAGSDIYFRMATFSGGLAGIGYTTGTSSLSGVSICSGDITQAVLKVFTGKNVKITDVTNNLHTLAEEDSAVLSLDSTTRGFLPPRMTTVEMNTISSPATGLMIYDTTTNQWMGNNGTPASPNWVIIG